jgi:hypothetical protein
MNQDIIFEKAKLAGLPISWWEKAKQEGETKEWRELQKFAELIVRECMEIVNVQRGSLSDDSDDWSDRDFGYDCALDDAKDMIKQHFGVKE